NNTGIRASCIGVNSSTLLKRSLSGPSVATVSPSIKIPLPVEVSSHSNKSSVKFYSSKTVTSGRFLLT
ncbi:hypothetical protein K0M31_003377, partial [Melipona bicolor]